MLSEKETVLPTAAVGLITGAQQAEDILSEGQADVILLARSCYAILMFLTCSFKLGRSLPIFRNMKGQKPVLKNKNPDLYVSTKCLCFTISSVCP